MSPKYVSHKSFFLARLSAKMLFAAGLTVSLLPGAALASDGFSEPQKTEIQSIIKGYLLENPEILRDAINELERREEVAQSLKREKALSDDQSPLYKSTNQAVIGNPDGKVTLIEFFDYNCGYCKHALDDLAKLMKDNPDLRVVLKDLPILSPGSIEAAAIATAARNQFQGEKFWEFHQKLLGSRGQVGKAQALAVAKDLGADMDKLNKDAALPSVKEGIQENDDVAKGLLMNGTPSYVVGGEVIVGAVGYDQLKAKIDNVRKCGKAACS
jgi:protein-disulfide isomerase